MLNLLTVECDAKIVSMKFPCLELATAPSNVTRFLGQGGNGYFYEGFSSDLAQPNADQWDYTHL